MKYLIIFVLVLMLAACWAPPPNKLIIGTIRDSFDHFPVYLAYKLGNLDSETYILKMYDNDSKLAADIANGRIDVAICPVTNLLRQLDQGKKIHFLHPLVRQQHVLAFNWQTDSLKALDNAPVGFIKYSPAFYLTQELFAKKGLKLNPYFEDNRSRYRDLLQRQKISGAALNCQPLLKLFYPQEHLIWLESLAPYYPATWVAASPQAFASKQEYLKNLRLGLEESCKKLTEPHYSAWVANEFYGFSIDITMPAATHTYYLCQELQGDLLYINNLQNSMRKNNDLQSPTNFKVINP